MYADQWGTYNGLTYSTWEVNPPNPTGYAPTMMVTCMNDPGTGTDAGSAVQPGSYSQFCYEIPFMPGQTQYMDTPVVPTSAFAGAGYNNPDCAYPDATPAVSEVDGDGVGPWVSAAGNTLTINALGDQSVTNNAYSGPRLRRRPTTRRPLPATTASAAPQGTVTHRWRSAGDATITELERHSDHRYRAQRQCRPAPIQQQAQYRRPARLRSAASWSSRRPTASNRSTPLRSPSAAKLRPTSRDCTDRSTSRSRLMQHAIDAAILAT